jgi:hypothetical protein
VMGRDILRKIVLGKSSIFKNKDNKYKVISSQSLWIDLLD